MPTDPSAPSFRRGWPSEAELEDFLQPPNEVTWARGRSPDRTYASATFTLDARGSRDQGQPARFIVKVFDESTSLDDQPRSSHLTWTEDVVYTTPGGRKQLKLMVARESGQVRELVIQKVPTDPGVTTLQTVLKLDREAAGRLIELVQALQYIPVEGGEKSVRLDDQTIRDFFSDPDAVMRFYQRDPDKFRKLIASDANADDVIAVAGRRSVVEQFRRLLDDDEYFDAANGRVGGPENVWQEFLERNPWILGASLAGQLLTSWSETRLEQTVAGFSVGGVGKRADALMRTSGQIRSLVFAEIKHHRTDLVVAHSYRSGAWQPSKELTGGVTQSQQTVYRATQDLHESLRDIDVEGADTGEETYLVRPRSYLIVGNLMQLKSATGGVHRDKHRSFELYRRNLYEPEVVTFDELLARAEWHVTTAEAEARESPG